MVDNLSILLSHGLLLLMLWRLLGRDDLDREPPAAEARERAALGEAQTEADAEDGWLARPSPERHAARARPEGGRDA